MITCLFGKPGSGKSYEAVAFQLIPALERGRLVITNLPIDVSTLAEDYPDAGDLVQVVEGVSVYEGEGENRRRVSRKRPFADMSDYVSTWKHPELGVGPLFIIDECHFVYPLSVVSDEEKQFLREVSEWFSMHRHQNVDVVLVTQSYGKVYKHIRDMVETWIALRNNRNLGFSSTYRRFAGDDPRGIHKEGRGDIRRYNKRIFSYYQSHTLGGKGAELGPQDVKPIWHHPIFYLLGVMVLVIGWMVATDRFHPLAALSPHVGSVPVSSAQAPASSVSRAVPAPPLLPMKEAVLGGHVGNILLIKVGGRVQSLSEWQRGGAVLIGEAGKCPWALVFPDGPAKGVCAP